MSFAWRYGASPNLHANQLTVGVITSSKQGDLKLTVIRQIEPIEPVARICLIFGENADKIGDGCPQFFERFAAGQLLNLRCRFREGEDACAESVFLKWRNLDDGWHPWAWAIGIAVTGAVRSERREMQVALRRSIFIASAAMVHEGDCTLISWREDEEWLVLVLKKRAQIASARNILLKCARKGGAAQEENEDGSFHMAG
jgi:hypothetical protein